MMVNAAERSFSEESWRSHTLSESPMKKSQTKEDPIRTPLEGKGWNIWEHLERWREEEAEGGVDSWNWWTDTRDLPEPEPLE